MLSILRRTVAVLFGLVLLAAESPSVLLAQAAGGAIEGRVQNRVTGDSLNNARVTVKGTNHVALTDSSGHFSLSGVPAGTATLDVFFTGLDPKQVTVNVVAGQAAQQDVQLTSVARYGDSAETVQLDPFLVQSTRETDAAAIAVNEQRFSLGQKSVISADQFGNIQRYDANIWTFVGPDRLPSTQDDNAAQIQAVNVVPERDSYYDSPGVPRISLRRLYNLYVANPA